VARQEFANSGGKACAFAGTAAAQASKPANKAAHDQPLFPRPGHRRDFHKGMALHSRKKHQHNEKKRLLYGPPSRN
jgi:hypothetical protein